MGFLSKYISAVINKKNYSNCSCTYYILYAKNIFQSTGNFLI